MYVYIFTHITHITHHFYFIYTHSTFFIFLFFPYLVQLFMKHMSCPRSRYTHSFKQPSVLTMRPCLFTERTPDTSLQPILTSDLHNKTGLYDRQVTLLCPEGTWQKSPAECGHARHVLPDGDGSWEVVVDHGVHQHQVHHSLHISSHAKVLIVVACTYTTLRQDLCMCSFSHCVTC